MHLPGSQTFAVGMGQGDAQSPAVTLDITLPDAPHLSYQKIAYGMAAWSGDVRQHLFYFRRFVDASLPLDVRWLNGYRLLEWHFVRDNAGLSKSSEWRAFVARFERDLQQFLRPQQTTFRLLEEARALAAHAGMDRRSDAERAGNPRNAMENTFRVLAQMVTTVLNEHPSRAGNPVRFDANPGSA
jgi:hypothetical protein